MSLWQRNDVRKFDSDAFFCSEKFCVEKECFNVKAMFSDWSRLNQVTYTRTGITHVCFTTLTLAGSLRRC